jgi:CheY-like chemotaxis protein
VCGERGNLTDALPPYASRKSSRSYHFIALAANAMKGDKEKCLDVGMDEFLTKPVTLEGLEIVLERVIPRSSTHEEVKSEELVVRSER